MERVVLRDKAAPAHFCWQSSAATAPARLQDVVSRADVYVFVWRGRCHDQSRDCESEGSGELHVDQDEMRELKSLSVA